MPSPPASRIPTAFATCSIGTAPLSPEFPLPERLRALSKAGFTGIELSMPDLIAHAGTLFPDKKRKDQGQVAADDYATLCAAGADVRRLCAQLRLQILMLQPFANFEGWPRDSPQRADAFARAHGWCRVMRAAGTDMLQVGSTDTPSPPLVVNVDERRAQIVADLRELADILAAAGSEQQQQQQYDQEQRRGGNENSGGFFRLCYENWCWSTHAPGWRDVWEVVREVDRSNVGLCLDTFQTAGALWADPTTESGLREDVNLQQRWERSLQELTREVPPGKIFLLQVSDAYKPRPSPLKPETLDPSTGEVDSRNGLRPRGRWSHDFRPMPFENGNGDGGYLPVVDVAAAVLGTGFRGWFSLEIFDGGPEGKGRRLENLQEWADTGMERLRRVVEEGLERAGVDSPR